MLPLGWFCDTLLILGFRAISSGVSKPDTTSHTISAQTGALWGNIADTLGDTLPFSKNLFDILKKSLKICQNHIKNWHGPACDMLILKIIENGKLQF